MPNTVELTVEETAPAIKNATATAQTKEALLDEMLYCGIHGALVYHNVARDYDPAYGNAKLTDEIGDDSRLLPCWVVLLIRLKRRSSALPQGGISQVQLADI